MTNGSRTGFGNPYSDRKSIGMSEMEAYDALPIEVRKLIQDAPYKATATTALDKLHNFLRRGRTAEEWILAVRSQWSSVVVPKLAFDDFGSDHPQAKDPRRNLNPHARNLDVSVPYDPHSHPARRYVGRESAKRCNMSGLPTEREWLGPTVRHRRGRSRSNLRYQGSF